MKKYSLGIDIGGTFTDVVLLNMADGRYVIHKELTTTKEPEVGVLRGVEWLLNTFRVDPASIDRIVHATTLFTNALIERRGAKTGVITTEGFRDVLEIGRERRYDLYDNFLQVPTPLVPRKWRREVVERIGPDGEIDTPLDSKQVVACAGQLIEQGVTSIAVAFLHSYKNPLHEQQAVKLIEEKFPYCAISSSSEVVSEIREYERFTTAVANAYVKPIAERYISLLEARLKKNGIMAPLFLMQSNGGLVHTDAAKRFPIQLLESGPAAGALVAAHFGRKISESKLLAFDMGGTTAKLSVVDDGEPSIAYSFEAARQKRFRPGSGMPIKISTVELIEIGAGGGSIAHVDELGLLRVGPVSAGSDPGPACYMKGGTDATVTDANLTLGYLNPKSFAGGSIQISDDAAQKALASVADALDMPTSVCSRGVSEVVNENMAAAARVHIAERGGDVRDYSLLVTGGGGPLHGYSVARKLGLRRMICPPSAGVASALGLLIAPPKVTNVATISARLSSISQEDLDHAYKKIETVALQTLESSGAFANDVNIQRYADLRFVGQGFELVTELPAAGSGVDWYGQIKEAFAQRYQEVFTITPPVDDIEIVNIRVSVSGLTDSFLGVEDVRKEQTDIERTTRLAYCPDLDKEVSMLVLRRTGLQPNEVLQGPIIVEDDVSTLIVGTHGKLRQLDNGLIVVDMEIGGSYEV